MKKTEELNKIKENCLKCQRCELSKTRTNVVFSDGNPDSAKAILIGEAPGANEDMSGIPFVGRAGKLLNEFLEKAGISRENDLYIMNTVKCRPPENRVPTDVEKKACKEYLLTQIDIVQPKIILLCGATALKSFIKEKKAISKIRGEIFNIEVKGNIYKAMPIFHPSYLLRSHSMDENSPRGLTLRDLKFAKTFIN